MRAAAPSRGRMGTFSAASSRTRPRFPGALQQTSPVREASYTILRRPPTTNDGVRSMQPTEAQQSNEVAHKPCADGKGESPTPATSHPAVGRGATFRTRGWRPRRGTGTLWRRGQSAAERCCRTTVEHYYEQEDWEKECSLSNGSTAEDGGDRKTTKKEGQKRVHWEEDDRLTTVYTVPSRSSRPTKMVAEEHHEGGDWKEGCVSPPDSTAEIQSDEAVVVTDEREKQEEEENTPDIECSALEQTGDSAAVETTYEEEDWEPECRASTEPSLVTQQEPPIETSERQNEEQPQRDEEAPATSQSNGEKTAKEEAWKRECAPLMDSSEPTRRKPETTVTKEREAEHRFEQEAPATSQSNREKMAKDEAWKRECAPLMDSSMPTRRTPETTVTWEPEAEHCFEEGDLSRALLAIAMQTELDTSGSDEDDGWDDDDDLSGDEPTVIIRLDPRPEEEERTPWQSIRRQTSHAAATSRAAAISAATATYTAATTSVASATSISSAHMDLAAGSSGVSGYFGQVPLQHAGGPYTTEPAAATTAGECGQHYTTDVAGVASSTVQMVPVVSYLCFPVVMYQACTVETPSTADSLPSDESTVTPCIPKENSLTADEISSQQSAATLTSIGIITPQLLGPEEDWQQGSSLAPPAESSETNGNCSEAATDALTSVEGENWDEEIDPGKAGYVPQVPTFFQKMRHKSQRQRRRLYREQAANFRQQEENRERVNSDGRPVQSGEQRPSDGSGPSGEGFRPPPPAPPAAVGATCQGMFPVAPQGSQPDGAAANRTGRRTMADVVRSGLPAAPAQPVTSSRPVAAVGTSYGAAAGDQASGQVMPAEQPALELAAFLQSAWTVASNTSGCRYYQPKQSGS